MGLRDSFVPVMELPARPLMVAGCTAAKVAREAMASVPVQLTVFSVRWDERGKGIVWAFDLFN